MERIKTVYVCRGCGALYTEPHPMDEGTAPCDDCDGTLVPVKQNEDGTITPGDLIRALGDG